MSQPSLVRRLVGLAAGFSLLILVLGAFGLTALYRISTEGRFEGDLEALIDDLVAEATVSNDGRVTPPILSDQRALRIYSGRYWQFGRLDPSGKVLVVARSRSLWQSRLVLPQGVLEDLGDEPGRTVFYNVEGPLKEPLRVAAQRISLSKSAPPVVVFAAENRSFLDRDIARFQASIIITLVLFGTGLVLAILLQVRVGLQPLFRLRDDVVALRKGEADRLVSNYSLELDPLAEELNALVSHNQEVVERQRAHAGNLAHALKTPLSVILSEARAQPGQLAEVVAQQAELMHAQVDHHLRRARAAARAVGLGDRTPLAPVLDELAVTLERVHQPRGVEIDWRCPDELVFLGERQDLMEIVGNLIDNSCKWARRRIRINAVALAEDKLLLTVEDDGEGLPQAQRQAVLRRGERLDESAPGSGLGLSIVKDLVDAYGGTIALGTAGLGGLKVSLELPRAI